MQLTRADYETLLAEIEAKNKASKKSQWVWPTIIYAIFTIGAINHNVWHNAAIEAAIGWLAPIFAALVLVGTAIVGASAFTAFRDGTVRELIQDPEFRYVAAKMVAGYLRPFSVFDRFFTPIILYACGAVICAWIVGVVSMAFFGFTVFCAGYVARKA